MNPIHINDISETSKNKKGNDYGHPMHEFLAISFTTHRPHILPNRVNSETGKHVAPNPIPHGIFQR
jgi:hypothetical protein